MKRSMKKAIFITTVDITLKSFLLPYRDMLQAKGFEVDAACAIAGDQEQLLGFNNIFDIQLARNPFSFRNLSGLRQLCRLFKEKQYDLVHVHTPVAALIARLAWFLAGKPGKLVYTAHGFHFHKEGKWLTNTIYYLMEKFGSFFTSGLITISKEDFSLAKRKRLINPDKLYYMHGIGVDLERFSRENLSQDKLAELRQSLGINKDAKIVGFIGELNHNKCPDDIITAKKYLDKNIHLLVVGTGGRTEELSRLSQELKLENVHFLGYRNDIIEIMGILDILILPSLREGLPRVVMEAQGMGVPVVGTNIRGNRELLADGKGIIVPVKSPQAIAEAIKEILDSPEKRNEIKEKAYRNIKDYALDETLKQQQEIYKDIGVL